MGIFTPSRQAHAHCDLFCGVYDPALARIEAESVLQASKKYHGSDDEVFRSRCITVKESQAELVKRHLSVLWTDFFKPHHLEQFPQLHDLFWKAMKAAGDAKKSTDPAVAEGPHSPDRGYLRGLLADRRVGRRGALPAQLNPIGAQPAPEPEAQGVISGAVFLRFRAPLAVRCS